MSDSIALVFGAAIVLLYSYDRFNIATYAGEARLERLVALISPDRLRARGTVLKAYLIYAGMLVAIYLFLCGYAEVLPVLGGPTLVTETLGASQLPIPAIQASDTAGFAPVGGGAVAAWAQPLSGPDETNAGIGIAPSVSLTVALIMVGLAPTFPVLARFDGWMRSVAHRLAGIPTWVLEAEEDLRTPRIGQSYLARAPLIAEQDRQRIRKLREVSPPSLRNDVGFWDDLRVITAISTWIVDDKVHLSKVSVQVRFDRLEKALRTRRDGLFQQLDGIIQHGGFAGAPQAPAVSTNGDKSVPEATGIEPGAAKAEEAGASNAEAGEIEGRGETNADGKSGASETPSTPSSETIQIERLVADLAADLRILVALYVEHGVIDYDRDSGRLEDRGKRTSQQVAAKAALRKYAEPVRNDQGSAHDTSYAAAAWLWSVGIVLVLAVVWSMTLGGYETILQRTSARGDSWRALNYAVLSFNVYGLTLLIALAIRDGFRQQETWYPGMETSAWTRWLPQIALVGFAAWLGAMLFMVGVSIWQSAIRLGWATVKANLSATIEGSFGYNAPTALRGVLLALIVISLLDRRQSAADRHVRQSGGKQSAGNPSAAKQSVENKSVERRLVENPVAENPSATVGDQRVGNGADDARPRDEVRSSLRWARWTALAMFVAGFASRALTTLAGTKPSFDGVTTGLLLYAAANSALIGFFVVFCVSEMLFHKLGHRQGATSGRRPDPGPDGGGPDGSGPDGSGSDRGGSGTSSAEPLPEPEAGR